MSTEPPCLRAIMIYNMNYTLDQVAIARPAPKPTHKPGKSYPPPGYGIDPNDLTRRLYAVLSEQKAQAERRRRARAEAMGQTMNAPVGPGRPWDGHAQSNALAAAAVQTSEVRIWNDLSTVATSHHEELARVRSPATPKQEQGL